MTETTKDKILDAAERLFAESGFAGVSLRTIIRDAGVNTASVHYHFGSKGGLITAVLERRAGPVNDARLVLLDDVESRHPDGPLPLEELVEAFLNPVALIYRTRGAPPWLPRLMGRAITEADENFRGIIFRIFGEVLQRFSRAFARALPELTPRELEVRIHFMLGAMAFSVAFPKFHSGTEDDGALGNLDLVLRQLKPFVSAGMRAPMPKDQPEAKL